MKRTSRAGRRIFRYYSKLLTTAKSDWPEVQGMVMRVLQEAGKTELLFREIGVLTGLVHGSRQSTLRSLRDKGFVRHRAEFE